MIQKYILGALILLFIIPVSHSLIEVSTSESSYNLGDKIKVHASVLKEEDFDGMFSLKLNCPSRSLQFYLTPALLEKEFRTSLDIPEFKADSSMLGNCTISGLLLKNDEPIEGYNSNGFEISGRLVINPLNNRLEAAPGDLITIDGTIEDSNGDVPSGVEMEINFNGKAASAKIFQGSFNSILSIPKVIKSGSHSVSLNASDNNGNSGEEKIALEITPLPARIEIEIEKQNFNPGEIVRFKPVLFDQNRDRLDKIVAVELRNPDGIKVLEEESASNKEVEYKIEKYGEPGTYTITAKIENLDASEFFAIPKIKEVKITYKDDKVFVENVGNVLYEDDIELKIEGGKDYTVTKEVSLEPGEVAEFDLTKDVEGGVYDIKLNDDNNSTIKIEKEDGEHSETENSASVAEKIILEDNRPLLKKIASGLSRITAAVVGTDGLLTKNPLIAPGILIIIVLLISMHYSRWALIKRIFRKR